MTYHATAPSGVRVVSDVPFPEACGRLATLRAAWSCAFRKYVLGKSY